MSGTAWANLQPVQRNTLDAVRAQFGLPPLTSDPPARDFASIVGTGGPKGTERRQRRSRGTARLEVFAVPAQRLETANVGGRQGFADRGAVADAAFAKTAAGDPRCVVGLGCLRAIG